MKTLTLVFTVLCLISCKKQEFEMAATHPEYSFVRLNEDGFNLSDCDPDVNKCLPIKYLDDVKFQLITDFPDTVAPSGITFIVAYPCQDNYDNAENVFNDLFVNTQVPITVTGRDATGADGGMVGGFAFQAPTLNADVGDIVYISAVVTSGVDVSGFHKITIKDGAWYYTDFYIPALITTSCINVVGIPDGYIFGFNSQILPANSEFTGTNYAWNINTPSGHVVPYESGECFSLCVWKMTITNNNCNEPTFNSGLYLGSTNCFEYRDDICFSTVLEYGCNEDAFGFYGQGFFNSIRLPMYLSRANYDSDEKGYQKSNGQFVKLTERVNKIWELRTDFMPEQWHDRLRVALSCDTVKVTNENANVTYMDIYKKDEYEVDWDSEVDFPLAKGSVKVFKGLFRKSLNSNCV